MECPECGEKMARTTIPETVVSYMIPLTALEVTINRWINHEYCTCFEDAKRERYAEKLQGYAAQKGYEEGFKDGRYGRDH